MHRAALPCVNRIERSRVSANTTATSFAARLLAWFDPAGRHDLPWRRDRTPYRVWISEVMLQQTQVATVIPYYRRFTERFPDLPSLAQASLDEVLHYWSGLGYYARGRNLHRAAQIILAQHGGTLPAELPALMALPGIGRSTAGAILALAYGQRFPILDANVKRVLMRWHAEAGDPGCAATVARLWAHSDAHTPSAHVDDYTQAIMDLGATICVRQEPKCGECPVVAGCAGYEQGVVARPPARRRRSRPRPQRYVCMVVVRSADTVLLQRRPTAGIWGGLWGLPEFADARAARAWIHDRFPRAGPTHERPTLRHSFTHFDLDITPLVVAVPSHDSADGDVRWCDVATPGSIGLATPVARLIRDQA
jgi:A/G-specific adenine glycosylase